MGAFRDLASALLGVDLAPTADYLGIDDVSANQTKKITPAELLAGTPAIGLGLTGARAGAISALESDILHDRSRGALFFDDFVTNVVSGQNGIHVATVSGTGAVFSNTASIAKTFGMSSLSTGTTATGRCTITPPVIAFARWADGILYYDAIIRPTASTETEEFMVSCGLSSVVGANPTNGAYILYDRLTNPTNWLCRTNNAVNSADSGVAFVSDALIRQTVVLDSVLSEARYYINGAQVASFTSNLPSTSTLLCPMTGIYKSAGTTARILNVDLVQCRLLFNEADKRLSGIAA